MAGNDRRSEPEWPIRRDDHVRSAQESSSSAASRGATPALIALGGLLILLLTIWYFSGNRSPDQDKLTGTETAGKAASDAEARCSSKATYDLIKRDLFRRAADMRGSDRPAFERLATYASVRMENPVLESEDGDTGAINCSGSLSVDLPPGVAVVGGRRTLTANIDYSLQGAADRSGDVLLLRNAEAIVTPLATLTRTEAPEGEDPKADPLAPLDQPAPSGSPAAPASPEQPSAAPAELATAATRPSFNCGAARTRSEIAVCRNSGLAALDREMASQFSGAMSEADSEERALLQRTRNRFLGYRDSCGSDACIADAYRGRMREIRDIMSGTWRPNR